MNTLTDSEIVILSAADFAPKAGMLNSWKTPNSDEKYAGPELARALAAAAFLGLEASGAIQLELGRKKALFGLREVTALYVKPTGQPATPPVRTFEAGILAEAAALSKSGKNTVEKIVYQVLGEDSSSVWYSVLFEAQSALVQRGMLTKIDEKKFLGIGLPKFEVVGEALPAITREEVNRVRGLLSRAETGRTEIWKQLSQEIKKGFDSRRESADVD